MKQNKQLMQLGKCGQSIWYDNLSRDVLQSGELEKLISGGVSGLTSNPTIFKKAIADSSDYDSALKALIKHSSGAEEICEQLMVEDVQAAADLLKPVYEETEGRDGYASLEVSPFLACDTEGTIAAAEKLWGYLERPNVMIKVPATNEGLPAIEELLCKGINVNVTLIFSVDVYRQVIAAYLSALEKRAEDNLPLAPIASVASFFVSRVDAICEKNFDALVGSDRAEPEDKEVFLGKVGIENCRQAYSLFKSEFGTERFAQLRAKGARVQRPLWASTGTKNPDFNPLLYVEELVGADTVNTLPPKTLSILMQKAVIEDKLAEDVKLSVIPRLADLGINLRKQLDVLKDEGVESFAQSYRELLAAVETKVAKL
jgi:transaldolase